MSWASFAKSFVSNRAKQVEPLPDRRVSCALFRFDNACNTRATSGFVAMAASVKSFRVCVFRNSHMSRDVVNSGNVTGDENGASDAA